ncbi:hypothetical protein [Kaistella palustris]|uniref:hypothetical protein n=1 Tax=Kaistella palustris TaxID=493376 RepID=UPI0004004811|nr:hypothetical protein [Kaistella palustris]
MFAKSNVLGGNYYLLIGNEIRDPNYNFKDTVVANRKITIAVSKDISYKPNIDFLLNLKLDK